MSVYGLLYSAKILKYPKVREEFKKTGPILLSIMWLYCHDNRMTCVPGVCLLWRGEKQMVSLPLKFNFHITSIACLRLTYLHKHTQTHKVLQPQMSHTTDAFPPRLLSLSFKNLLSEYFVYFFFCCC